MSDPSRGYSGGLTIRAIELIQVALNALLELFHSRLEFALREVLVAIVDRLELAAVDRHDRLGEQLQPAAQLNELSAHLANRFAVILAKVGDRFKVRHQPPSEPNQLDIALRLPLKAAAGLNPVEVAIDVDLQQHRRVVRGPTGLSRLHAIEAKSS